MKLRFLPAAREELEAAALYLRSGRLGSARILLAMSRGSV
jgi:hypothetical protein